MSCTSTLYNVMKVMTHGHTTASGSSLASLFAVHDVQTRVSSLSRTSVVWGHGNVYIIMTMQLHVQSFPRTTDGSRTALNAPIIFGHCDRTKTVWLLIIITLYIVFHNNYCRRSCVCCLFFITSPTTLTYSFFSTKLSSLIEFPISCSSKYDAGPLRLIVFEVVRVRKLVDCNKNAVGFPYPVSFMMVVGEAGWPRS